MLQEAAQELLRRESHGAGPAVMRVVLPAKGDVMVVHRQQSMVGDRHAMGVASQILKHVLWPAKGSLGVDDPVLLEQSAHESRERLLVRQGLQLAVKGQSLAMKRLPQSGDELPAKDAAEHSHRQEEVGRGADPTRVIRRQSATGHDAMDVRVALQSLSPRMQDTEEADLRAEARWIGCDFQQRGSTGIEQEAEQELLVLPY